MSFCPPGLAARLTFENSDASAEPGLVQRLPFELEVVEAALLEATWELEQRLTQVGPRVQKLYDAQQNLGAKAITNEVRAVVPRLAFASPVGRNAAGRGPEIALCPT